MSDAADPVEHRPLIVAGTGSAGLTAAIYAARSNNDPLVFEGDEPGGQLTLTSEVENFPGFPEGINGTEFITATKKQAKRFGAEITNGVVESVERIDDAADAPAGASASAGADPAGVDPRPFRVELSNGDVYTCDAFIAASGASARTLGVPGEDELMGYGLSTCATCDGAFFRGEDMVVVGGGDAAMEEASFLTKFADTVYLVHRREEFRAEDYWIDRLMEHVEAGDVEIVRNTEVTELHGSREDGVDSVSLVSHPGGHPKSKLDDETYADEVERTELDVGAAFYAIGHTPNTEFLTDTGVELDAEGYIRTEGSHGGGQTETGVPGLFGAGDVVDYHYQQAVTAAGMGCKAAIDADGYLEELARAAEERPEDEAKPAAVEGDD